MPTSAMTVARPAVVLVARAAPPATAAVGRPQPPDRLAMRAAGRTPSAGRPEAASALLPVAREVAWVGGEVRTKAAQEGAVLVAWRQAALRPARPRKSVSARNA